VSEKLLNALERALEDAGCTHDLYEDVAPAIACGRAQYWQNDGAAVVTEVIRFPRVKTVNYWLIGGELEAVIALTPQIESWARKVGCTRATALGRAGWGGYAERHGWQGWRRRGVAYSKELMA
jgi:hypothetical protein